MNDLFRIRRSTRIFIGLFLGACVVLWLFPLYSAVERSFLGNGLHNYATVLTRRMGGVSVFRVLANSLIIAATGSTVLAAVAALAGFAYSKIRFRGRDLLYVATIVFLAIPTITLIVPLFRGVLALGLYDTYLAVILPEVALTLPFGVLMLKNFGDSLPDELMEAGVMDGATTFQLFANVYAPLARYSLANLFLLSFIWSFKDYLLPLVLTISNEMVTATLAVSRFEDALVTTLGGIGEYSASIIVLAIPLVVIFGLTQRLISGGLVSGAVKS